MVTHPDLDHLRGLPALIRAYPPKRAWRFPFGGVREMVSNWCRRDPRDRRLREVDAAFAALEELEDRNIAYEAGLRTETWCPDSTVEVRCLAPTQHDVRHGSKWLFDLATYATANGLKEKSGDEPMLGSMIRSYLLGEGSLDERPNLFSLAITVRWRARRLLLCGDVETGRASPYSGWKGILQQLEEDRLLDCVQEIDVVKVAHHGSNSAFHPPAWQLHRRSDGATFAALTPFNRSTPPLPRAQVLDALRSHVEQLGITDDARGAFALALASGWSRRPAPSLPTLGPHMCVVLPDGGALEVHAGLRAGVFGRKVLPLEARNAHIRRWLKEIETVIQRYEPLYQTAEDASEAPSSLRSRHEAFIAFMRRVIETGEVPAAATLRESDLVRDLRTVTDRVAWILHLKKEGTPPGEASE